MLNKTSVYIHIKLQSIEATALYMYKTVANQPIILSIVFINSKIDIYSNVL